MQVIDKFQEIKKELDIGINRKKLWIASSRKRSYFFCFIFVDVILFWSYWPLFFKYGLIGFQPLKLFGILLGFIGGEWFYTCGQYMKFGNPKKWSKKQFIKIGTYMCIVTVVSCTILAVAQGVIWNICHVDLAWLTGIGPVKHY